MTPPLGFAFCAVLIMPNKPIRNEIRAISAALYPFRGLNNFSIILI
jgi:hypothetical protein